MSQHEGTLEGHRISIFAIPNNDQDPTAEQPELAHPLRPEQLRSLGWMLAQEAAEDRLKGGLLADKMGYGKTSVAIALISKDLQLRERRLSEHAAAEKLLSDSTLLVAPSHLIDQWEQEFEKFLPNRVEIHRSRAAPIEKLEFTAKAHDVMMPHGPLVTDRAFQIATSTLAHFGTAQVVIQGIGAAQERCFQRARVKIQLGDLLKSIVLSDVIDANGCKANVTIRASSASNRDAMRALLQSGEVQQTAAQSQSEFILWIPRSRPENQMAAE